MTIKKIDGQLPTSTKIEDLNDMILELDGRMARAEFNEAQIDSLYSGSSLLKQFRSNYAFGNVSTGASAWYNWSHFRSESGYSIWKFPLLNFRHNIVNNLYIDDIELEYMGNATSESATTYASVFLYNGATYADDTTEAGTEGGSEFDLMSATTHYLYVGDEATFTGIAFNFETLGAYYTLALEYYNGSTWIELTAARDQLEDHTDDFSSNGSITFDAPADWTEIAVNLTSHYWIRISTTTTPTTTAKAYYIMPTDSIPTLLQLSSNEVLDADWKWAYYGSAGDGNIYVTIRNAGKSAYEGDYYIASSSSFTNKENYFRYNHDFKLDFEDSIYTGAAAGCGFSDVNPRVNDSFKLGQYQKAYKKVVLRDQYGTRKYYQIYVSGGGLCTHQISSSV